jgi:DNA-binding NarL/FixJ family response regulator
VPRVFVVGADRTIRDALMARVRGSHVSIVGSAPRWTSAAAPDVDIVLAERSGDVGDADDRDGPAVLLLTDDVEGSARALARERRTAWGVLPAGASPADVVVAIEAVARGLVVMPPGAARQGHPVRAGDRRAEAVSPALTAREHEVLVLASDGLSNREIASALGISDHTVKFHLASIYAKLGASTRTEAVQRGLRTGLIEL